MSVLTLAPNYLVRLSFKGPSLYWSDRSGKGNNNFKMPRIRSMFIGTLTLATHLIGNLQHYIYSLLVVS